MEDIGQNGSPRAWEASSPLTLAIGFIRDHADERMTVDDVVRVSGLSRRGLEKRFRTSLGRTVLDEIRLARAERMARLLVETDLSVAKIGERLGFADVTHLSRYFRGTMRMSPTRYRKTFARSTPAASLRPDGP